MNAMRWRAVVWAAAAITVAVSCVLQFRQGAGIETNLLTLLPATERNPVAEQVATRMAEGFGNRVVFLVGTPAADAANTTNATLAARAFGGQLRASGTLRSVLVDLPPIDLGAMAALYVPHRFGLLTSADQKALAAGDAQLARRLQEKLYAPPRPGLAIPVAADPFGLLDNWLAALPMGSSRLALQDGVLAVRDAGLDWVLVAGELHGSAYDQAVQRPLVEAVANAEVSLRAQFPGVKVLRVGTVFYAHTARDQAQREFDFIGGGSLVGMLLLLYWVFRSPGPLVLGVLSVAVGVGAACLATRWWFGSIHLITLVFGASLIGEAIDYAIQYFAARLGAGPRWEPMAGLRRIAPGLVAALATSLLGYGVLALSPFVALAQIGLFASVGLTVAWLSVFFLLPATLARPMRPRAGNTLAFPALALDGWRRYMGARQRFALAAALLLLAAPGWWQLRADDNIRLLVNRPPVLVAQEARIRALTGIDVGSQFFLVEGQDAERTLQNEEALVARLVRSQHTASAPVQAIDAAGAGRAVQAVSAFVPSHATQAANRGLWQPLLGDSLDGVLSQAGVRDEVAGHLRVEHAKTGSRPLEVADWLASPVSTPLRHLWQGPTAQGFASVVPAPAALDAAALQAAARDLPGVTLVDKAGSVSALFGQYRRQSAFWLAGALVLVYGVLALRYGLSRGAAVLLPTVLALGTALGAFGYLGEPLTLFHHMGFMLVLGVGANYAIFLCEGGTSEVATLAGVLLSAGTTLLAYGLLTFSSMPALSGFGLTLLLGVGLAALLAPMALSLTPVTPATQAPARGWAA